MPKCRRSQPLLHETHLVHIQACRNDEWKAAYAFQNGTYVAQGAPSTALPTPLSHRCVTSWSFSSATTLHIP